MAQLPPPLLQQLPLPLTQLLQLLQLLQALLLRRLALEEVCALLLCLATSTALQPCAKLLLAGKLAEETTPMPR